MRLCFWFWKQGTYRTFAEGMVIRCREFWYNQSQSCEMSWMLHQDERNDENQNKTRKADKSKTPLDRLALLAMSVTMYGQGRYLCPSDILPLYWVEGTVSIPGIHHISDAVFVIGAQPFQSGESYHRQWVLGMILHDLESMQLLLGSLESEGTDSTGFKQKAGCWAGPNFK